MTLPFRRRHNDAESSHDRARSLLSDDFAGSLDAHDAAWLRDHLERCGDCRTEREAYLADSVLLRGLRDRMPEPPRDLWARTAAAIDAEGHPARRRPALGQILPARGPRRLPLGVLASALVVLVVVGTALLPRGGNPITQPSQPGSSEVAVATPAGETPLVPVANRVAWVQRSADGTFSLVFADIDHACPGGDPTCAPLADSSPAPLALAGPPQAVVLSPGKNQIAVVGSDAETAGSVLIVDVPTPRPSASAGASAGPTKAPTAAPPTAVPSAAAPTPVGSLPPGQSASPAPGSARAIIRGVTVVGGAGYSADGQWLAFSARPKAGPGGPNLYVWHVGDAEARQITTDGETFFSGWYGNQIVASGIAAQDPSDGGSPSPSSTTGSDGSPEATDSPTATSTADGSASPAASSSPEPLEAHPYSFLLDPGTSERVEFPQPDVWLPTIDAKGRFVTYWSGTVVAVTSGNEAAVAPGQVESWRPAAGHLVLDGWLAPLAPVESPSPASPDSSASETVSPSAPPAATAAIASPGEPTPALQSPDPAVGPAGTPVELAPGPIADFDAHFDPTGSRLAVWVLDAPDSSAGRLWLVVLDPAAGRIDPSLQPMAAPGEQALRGFTIDSGRLAWATPAGQDGQPSSVHVLAWSGDEFGQVESVPGGNPQIVR